jgi:hypothetical protein
VDGLAEGSVVTSPYSPQPLEALMAAQTSVGLVLGALLWLRRLRPQWATLLLLAAIALVVVIPVEQEFVTGIGVTLGPDFVKKTLRLAAAMATLAALLTRRPAFMVVALVGEAAFWPITGYIRDCDWELAGAHLAFFGLLVGVHYRTSDTVRLAAPIKVLELPTGVWVDDVGAFLVGTVAAAIACRILLHGWTNSGDEWANTFEAALFAKGRAYTSVPRCTEAFRSFWVFPYMGRTVPEYTPGWPYFMTPFVVLHVAWLAGPASLGVLAAGVSRLARRAAAGFGQGTKPPPVAQVRVAGRFAAAAVVLGSTMLINGGSRYPHLFVAGMYAWSVEGLLAIASPGLSRAAQWRWGAVLGGCAALLVSARPADGVLLGTGLGAYFVYALVRRRMEWRSVVSATVAASVIGILSLVILRLQMGKWFATGYSLNPVFYPWNHFAWSVPKPNEYRAGLPFATGAYCWLPCSPAVGLAGVAACRGRAQRMGFIFFLSYLPHVVFYSLLEIGRNYDLGYGPRYQLPMVVPMAVGTGVMFGYLWAAASRRWSSMPAAREGGPLAVAVVSMLVGVVRIAPLVYPNTYADVQVHNRLHEALARANVHDAIVFAGSGLNNTDPMDLTENLPLDLYPNQDVLIALDRNPDVERCVKELYPKRHFYRAIAGPPLQIVPF